MLGKVSRFVVCASTAILLASCNSTGSGGSPSFGSGIGGLSTGQDGADKRNDTGHLTPLFSSGASSSDGSIGTAKSASGTTQRVVQGACPQIFMRDADAIYKINAKGGKTDDQAQIKLQAWIGNYTRQCTVNEENLNMTVVAQLRLVAGADGFSGKVNLPIRITVEDDTSTYYSEVTNFQAELPAGQGSTQVLFRKDGIKLPLGSGALVRVNIGFDQGTPAKSRKKK